MPRLIPLSKQPNQSFSFGYGRNAFIVAIKQAHGCMAADIIINGVQAVTGQRICAGTMVLPYRKFRTYGNFVFRTDNDEQPWWENFGSSCNLDYITPDEISESRPDPLPEQRLPVNG